MPKTNLAIAGYDGSYTEGNTLASNHDQGSMDRRMAILCQRPSALGLVEALPERLPRAGNAHAGAPASPILLFGLKLRSLA